MKTFLIFLLCLLSVSAFGQGVAIRSLSGQGTNLTLKGSGALKALIVDTNKLVVNTNGNVGIGTNAPAAPLHVNGTARFGPIEIWLQGETNGNTGFGSNALDQVTTGFDNTAVGERSQTSLTTGFRNTAVGRRSQGALVDGQDNTSIGTETMLSATNASYNVAAGTYAMKELLSGNNNVGVGMHNSQENRTGSDNVAVGMQALQNNTQSGRNAAIGKSALGVNTNATGRNVAVGYRSSGSTTNANGCVTMGYQAGYSNQRANTLHIDNDDNANSLIYGEFDNDLIKINGSLTVTGAMAVSTGHGLKIGNGGVTLTNVLAGSATLDFASQTVGGAEDLPITVAGAADGDEAVAVVPVAATTGIAGSWSAIASNGVAFIRFVSTGTAQNPPSGTFKVIVRKYQ